MKALILGKFAGYGGTQYLSYRVKDVLDTMGYETDILTGKQHSYQPDNIKNVIETGFPYRAEKSRIDILRNIMRLNRELKNIDFSKYDFTFNNHPNNFLVNADINYLHGPVFVETMINEDGNLSRNRLYYLVRGLRIYNVFNGARFLTHSRYTQSLALKFFPEIGVKPGKIDFIPIPVDTETDVDLSAKDSRTVLVFGRIARDKRLEDVFGYADKMDVNFIIAGFVANSEKDYLDVLRAKKPENVEIISNPTEEVKRRLFAKAWTYLHTKPREHFGVSVAEAISWGCVPVVPKSGGPWIDIVEEGKFGFGYKNEEELIQALNETFGMSLSEREAIYSSRERFSFEKFKERLAELVSETTRVRK